jgi:hypothetical protein
MKSFWVSVAFLVAMVFLIGCSRHYAPSAAQMMNVREGENFGIGTTLRTGDLYSSDKVGYREERTFELDENNWNIEWFTYSKHSYFLIGLNFENVAPRVVAGVRTDYLGLFGWYGIPATDENDHDHYPAGAMLAEQLPINEKIKIGVSEYISNNMFPVEETTEGRSKKTYVEMYTEVGGGLYAMYNNTVSVEFRVGKEWDEPNYRYYLLVNIAGNSPPQKK